MVAESTLRADPAPVRVNFLGCPVDRVTIPQILERMAAARAGGPSCHTLVVNANKLHLMEQNPRLREIVYGADLVIPEWAVVWGARQLGLLPLYHSGGMLVAKALLPFAAARGLRLYLLGAQPAVVARLAARLREDHPRLPLAGYHDGYLTKPEVDAAVVDDIQRTRPDILLVAMGSPKQEYWLADHRQNLNVPASIGVGGSFDVLSGAKPDTPPWARGRGIEWLYRISLDPRAYARRYLVTNTWFVFRVLLARFGLGQQSRTDHSRRML